MTATRPLSFGSLAFIEQDVTVAEKGDCFNEMCDCCRERCDCCRERCDCYRERCDYYSLANCVTVVEKGVTNREKSGTVVEKGMAIRTV